MGVGRVNPRELFQFGQTQPGSPLKRRRLAGHVDTGPPPGPQAGRPPSSPGPRPLLGGAKGHGEGGHQHLQRDVLPHQQQQQQHLLNKQHLREAIIGRPPGGLRAVVQWGVHHLHHFLPEGGQRSTDLLMETTG